MAKGNATITDEIVRKRTDSEDKLYVHYGSKTFDKNRFRKVENMQDFLKPKYGLWGSTVDSKKGWSEWCVESGHREISLDACFYFRIRGRQVYEIRKGEDLKALPQLNVLPICQSSFETQHVYLDFEKICEQEYPYFALDIQIGEGEEQFRGYDCDCILVLDDQELVENHDAKFTNNPLTVNQLLPMKWYSTIMNNIEVSVLLKTPGGKKYIYMEQPDSHYGFKTIVACLSDGRIVETCGFTLEEAKNIAKEVIKEQEYIEKMINEHRSD